MSQETTLNTKGLENVLKMFKSKAIVKVGIIGKDNRSDGLTNSAIGAMHEFGTTKMPKRSFLKEPIADNLDKQLKETGLLNKNTMKTVIKNSSPVDVLKKVGIIAEGIVAEAFATNGYGKWAPWKEGYSNNTGNILVDTQQLRNSISSVVVE